MLSATYLFKVSWGRVWRRIAISGQDELDSLGQVGRIRNTRERVARRHSTQVLALRPYLTDTLRQQHHRAAPHCLG